MLCGGRQADFPAASRLPFGLLSPAEFLAQYGVIDDDDASRQLRGDVDRRRICAVCNGVLTDCVAWDGQLEEALETMRRAVLDKRAHHEAKLERRVESGVIRETSLGALVRIHSSPHAIYFTREDGRFPVSTSCVAISNPGLLFNS